MVFVKLLKTRGIKRPNYTVADKACHHLLQYCYQPLAGWPAVNKDLQIFRSSLN